MECSIYSRNPFPNRNVPRTLAEFSLCIDNAILWMRNVLALESTSVSFTRAFPNSFIHPHLRPDPSGLSCLFTFQSVKLLLIFFIKSRNRLSTVSTPNFLTGFTDVHPVSLSRPVVVWTLMNASLDPVTSPPPV